MGGDIAEQTFEARHGTYGRVCLFGSKGTGSREYTAIDAPTVV